jgi:pimeloyl-ACP methyl ester carboxylesterase
VWLLLAVLLADSTHNVQVPLARGESLHVEISGVGDPVVLIPGLFGSAFGFRTLVPLLTERGYRTIVIEPLGIGGSTRPPRADYTLAAQANRLAAVLDTLGVQHAIVVAHSVGGSEAFRLAYLRPDLVKALISLEGGPAETAATPAFKRAMRFAPWIKLLGGVRLIRWQIRKVLVASSGDARWVTDEVVQGYTAAAARDLDATLKAYLAMAAAVDREKLQPHLGEIRCPVRLVVGGAPHEGDVGPDEVVLLQRTVPQFALDSVPGAGHFLQEERPDAVLAAMVQTAAMATSAPSDGMLLNVVH